MDAFLRSTDVIDWRHPSVVAQAQVLRKDLTDAVAIARRCFEWVRDDIRHSSDHQLITVTCAGRRFCLHGLNAIFLPGVGWYRADARGNRAGVDAQFIPPTERLAFSLRLPGEADLPDIWPDPMPVVVNTIRAHDNAAILGENLPDLKLPTA